MHINKINEYNFIGIFKFGLNKILHTREVMALMNNNLPYNLIPEEFMGMFVINKTFREVIEIASERAVNSIIKDILREEKYLLRMEKKRPWATKTRRPFRGHIDKIEITFKDKIKLAEEIAEKIELPFKENKRGKPPLYNKKNFCSFTGKRKSFFC